MRKAKDMDRFGPARGMTQLLAALLVGLLLLDGCSTADASAPSHAQALASYEAALKPLKERSNVLEARYAAVQQNGNAGTDQLREVLREIIPAYAELLKETRAIKVDDAEVRAAQECLLASLESQQRGLDLALRALGHHDSALMTRAAASLERARALLLKHRRLISRARH